MVASDGEGISGCEGGSRGKQSSVRVVPEALQTFVLWDQACIRIRRLLSRFEKTDNCNFIAYKL